MKSQMKLAVALTLVGKIASLGVSESASQISSNTLPYRDSRLAVEARAADLLSRMTLEEKVAQVECLWQHANVLLDADGNFSPAKAALPLKDGIGEISMLAPPPDKPRSPSDSAKLTNSIQKYLRENTRLGIPAIVHGEGLHGFWAPQATSFPQAIALASTWDPSLVGNVFQVVAAEARARGRQQIFTPVLDVARDPRWGRTEETFGEDPYLVSRIGLASVRGLQGPFPTVDKEHVIATPKHFAVHGQPEGGRNIAPANYSERVIREFFLPPFKAAFVEGGAMSVMASFNEIDGVPSHANHWLLQKMLREEWGFQGFVVSDYSAVEQLDTYHHVASNGSEAAKKALEAGVDLDAPEGTSYRTLLLQVQQGTVALSTLDRSVARILRAKFQLGLFEDPYVDPDYAAKVCTKPEHRELALKAAHEAAVLLKNQGGLLPLDRKKIKTIAVIGPNAAHVRLGEYSDANPQYAISILQGIAAKVGSTVKVVYAQGCGITTSNHTWWDQKVELEDPEVDATHIAEAVAIAKTADVAIVAVGDSDQSSRESFTPDYLGDRDSLDLVGQQDALVKAVQETGVPTVVVLINGRPASIRDIAASVPAILEGWSLGQETGTAVADILFGDYNPSAKLPITVPRSVGQLPAYYNRKPTAVRGYLFDNSEPLFPFGSGLSYTTFQYGDPRLSAGKIATQGQTTVSVDVTNIGKVAGDEVAQLYIRDLVSSVTRPIKELKGFQRIHLEPGQTQTVNFLLTPDALAFWNENMQRVVEPGLFDVMVGGNSVDLRKVSLEVVAR